MKKIQALALSMMMAMTANAQDLIINEVMQSNIDCLLENYDFPDSWVELYNTSSAAIDISGWGLSVKDDPSKRYVFPSATVPAHGHIVIFCDKEENGLHTDFRVDSGKGGVYLYDANGEKVDEVALKKMPAPNVAYGRTADGDANWYYEYMPTPGSANRGGGASSVMPKPVFSISGGLFSSPIQLTVSLPEGAPGNAAIYYTTNGTEPSIHSANTPELVLDITSTTVVRAKVLTADGQCVAVPSTTQSYIFHPYGSGLPVISMVTDDDYYFDSTLGMWSSELCEDGIVNYMHKWRRPLNTEYYAADGTCVFNQLGETAVSGSSTREQPQKSMKLYANKRFGEKKFTGEFWKDKPQVKAVKSFVIRSGGNNSLQGRINDGLAQTLFGSHIDNIDYQAYQPVVVYLNGRYFGEFNMRERNDEDNVEANYGGLEDIEIGDETSYQEPEPGSLFEKFFNIYHSPFATYDIMCENMDVENFMNALACELYAMNTDFPTNNVSMWCGLPSVEDPELRKWHWIIKDLDRFGMNHLMYPPSFDFVHFLFDPDPLAFNGVYGFDLYKKMVSFTEFKELLLKSMAVYLGDFLKPSYVDAVITRMVADIKPEIEPTYTLYGGNYSDFTAGISYLRNICSKRPEYLYAQLADFFNVGSVVAMTVKKNGTDACINDIRLREGDFDGAYFSLLPLKMSTGNDNLTWRMTVKAANRVVATKDFTSPDVTVTLDDYITSQSGSLSVEWSVIDNPLSTIQTIDTDINNANGIYDIHGVRHNSLQKGINIIGNRKIIVK